MVATRMESMVYGGMKFPEKLSRLIHLRDKNQSRLMRETGISQGAISEMTRGQRRPYMDQAHLLARALDVPLDYLADDAQDDPPTPGGLNEDEACVLDVFRALGLGKDDALKALAVAAGQIALTGGPARGPGRIVAIRDETQADVAREREQRRKDQGRRESDQKRTENRGKSLPPKGGKGRK